MIVKQLSIFLENRTGSLTGVTQLLGHAGINLSAFSLADSSDFGILRVILSEPVKAKELLTANGFTVTLNDVVCLFVPNTPGTLAEALVLLAENNVSIDYMYAFAWKDDLARVVIKPDDIHRCIEVLQRSNLQLAKADEVYDF